MQSREVFVALGDRLSTPGKERLILQAQLSQPSRTATTLSVQVVLDISGAVRVDTTSGPAFSLTFNGQQTGNSVTPAAGLASTAADQQLVDALQYNPAEHFITTVIQGNAVQPLGKHFTLTDVLNPSNPPTYCEAFRTVESTTVAWRTSQQPKVYCFDSSTHLLAAVFYEATVSGTKTSFETRYTGWHSIETQPQMVPGKIEFRQNGVVQVAFTVQSASLAPEAADSLFIVP
jgi:hypothetical protein